MVLIRRVTSTYQQFLRHTPYVAAYILIHLFFFTAARLFDWNGGFIVGLALIPFIILFLFQFKSFLFLLPASVFVDLHYFGFAFSEWYATFLVCSFILTYKNVTLNDLSFPFIRLVLLYLVVLYLSVLKSSVPFISVVLVNHIVLYIALVLVVKAALKDIASIRKMVYIFFVCVLANSVHVIVQALLTGKRVFGFAGVMFVDYVGIGISMMFVLALLHPVKRQRMLFVILTFINIIALILTQTRTTWMVTTTTMFLSFIFIYIHKVSYAIDGTKIRRVGLQLIMLITVGVMIASVVNPDTLSRLADAANTSDADVTESGVVKNSFISRLLIWHTGFNAFIANPVLGIGAYAFPFSSNLYYTIPEFLFETYVEHLSPHQTFIAVAIETGMIGLLVFSILWFFIFRYVIKIVLHNKGKQKQVFITVLGVGVIYSLLSMWTTDAWLWGHGIILLAFITGCFIAYDKLEIL